MTDEREAGERPAADEQPVAGALPWENARTGAGAGTAGGARHEAHRRPAVRKAKAQAKSSDRGSAAREQRRKRHATAVLRQVGAQPLMRADTDAQGWHGLLARSRAGEVCRWVALIFVVAVLGVFTLNIALPDRRFSESENRLLAQRPQLTRASVLSGEYMEDAESYVSDQFVGRDAWVTLKVSLERLAGKRESNGVYLGKDGELIEEPAEPAWDGVEANMQAVDDFAARHADVATRFCLAPNAYSVQSQLLPADAPVRDQEADIERIFGMAGDQVTCVDLTDALKAHADEYIYYRTDHHWTSLGASYAFDALAPTLDIEPPAATRDFLTVADDFQGTLASKSGYHGSRDTVQVYRPADAAGYIVEYVDDGTTTTSIYDASKLQEKDKYQVFFGGNHARVNIYTTATNKKNLLIVKDSYANCFVQFLLPYYESITIVDPRYYYDDIDTLVANGSITDVLFLYNVNTFVEDSSLADAIAPEQ